MKWAVYNILFLAAYPFLLPGFLARMFRRGGYAARFGDRFAFYPEDVRSRFSAARRSGDRFVWVRAVSVGEVQVASQFMKEWRRADPSVRFCLSTTSSTGWKTAEGAVREGDVLIYDPLDFPAFAKAAMETVGPKAVVLMESEIWPNFIRRAAKRGIPVFLVNARVSDRSAPRYRAARFFFGDIFRLFARIFAQSELDASRIRATYGGAGGRDNVRVTGSFKFDAAQRNEGRERAIAEWLAASGVKPGGSWVLLGGSTWPGEDKVLLDIYRDLLGRRREGFPEPVLAIAPRHFEKADAVEGNIRAAGFECIRRSREDVRTGAAAPVFLADTTGELMGLYANADAVFVGKSLCAHGGQNMIEPCLCGKPVFTGPYTENFRPVMSDLLAADAVVQARDAAELGCRIAALYEDAGLSGGAAAAAAGDRARRAVEGRRGTVARCVASIAEALK